MEWAEERCASSRPAVFSLLGSFSPSATNREDSELPESFVLKMAGSPSAWISEQLHDPSSHSTVDWTLHDKETHFIALSHQDSGFAC